MFKYEQILICTKLCFLFLVVGWDFSQCCCLIIYKQYKNIRWCLQHKVWNCNTQIPEAPMSHHFGTDSFRLGFNFCDPRLRSPSNGLTDLAYGNCPAYVIWERVFYLWCLVSWFKNTYLIWFYFIWDTYCIEIFSHV